MQVFKYALKVVFRNPVFLIVYAVALSFMGILMASGFDFSYEDHEYQREAYDITVIDRDGSEISAGIGGFMSHEGNEVAIDDTPISLQDAVAKGETDCIVMIPAGYGDALLSAVEEGVPVPEIEVAYSYMESEGALVEASLSRYLSALASIAAAYPGESGRALTERAFDIAAANSEVAQIPRQDDAAKGSQFIFYLQFESYVLFCSIVACIGMLLTSLNRTDIRRRALSSPVSYLSSSVQSTLACIVIMALICIWVFLLGFAVFNESAMAMPSSGLVLAFLSELAYATIPLAVAYLVAQFGIGAGAINAIGNLGGLVLSFLGGAWISMDLLTPGVQAFAHFLPGIWYTDALTQASTLTAGNQAPALGAAGDIGVMLLFTCALFAVAILVGKMRTQTSQAGGNAAAEGALSSFA